ncbi:class I SAM-dependent methyltransferase [Chachezhania sediminis]|uniref:class I SAM-dependent methyltransferase n=1 Tax=Chachezhania sediminis TaxID=2599291 RepID=UPI00131C6939|nr:class I SAM-dependent methyltransferase [Chachezhania sediminis]
MNVATAPLPDLAAVKARQQATWATGDYPAIGTTIQIVGENLAEAMDLRPDARVLDVAAGNGNATLAAARRGCNVVSTDYVTDWLKAGMARAEAEKLTVAFREADAENLPFEDGSFDAVMSTFGVMFTADQDTAAAELLRVCRSGGKIGLANWTPQGFIGQVFKTIGKHVPPPAGLRSPAEWGTEGRLRELFGAQSRKIDVRLRDYTFRLRSPEYWIESWSVAYGPMNKAFQAVGADGHKALAADLIALARVHSSCDRQMIVPAQYAEIVVHKA